MSELPEPRAEVRDDDDPPGGPWRSWPAIYVTLAVWGIACILLLIWMTGTLNVGSGS